MSCSVQVFQKFSLIAMEYIYIHAIKSIYGIIFHGWFLSIFIDMLVQSFSFFLFQDIFVHAAHVTVV